jgi:TolB-like protein
MEYRESAVEESFPDAIILNQVQRILESHLFKVSNILSGFLTYIVNETISGRSENLKEYNIAIKVLKKPLHFNPNQSGVVRVHARRLRDALNEYYINYGIENCCEIIVPKGGYTPIFKRFKLFCAPILQSKCCSLPLSCKSIKIAVMPFKSNETVQSTLSMIDSIGQILSTEIFRLSSFSVLSYYTTQHLQSRNASLKELYSRYSVQLALTGTIQVNQTRIYVFLELVSVETEVLVWSDRLDLDIKLFRNYDTDKVIANRVIASLKISNALFGMHVFGKIAKIDKVPTIKMMSSNKKFS